MVAAARPVECLAPAEYCSTRFRCISSFNVPEAQLIVILVPFTKGNIDTRTCCLPSHVAKVAELGCVFASHRVRSLNLGLQCIQASVS